MVVIKLISDNFKLKKPKKFEKNIFTRYSPSKYHINETDTITIDTDLLIDIPKNCTAYLAGKLKGQDVKEYIGPCNKRLWITLLNQSYFSKYKINKGNLMGYLLFEPEDFNVRYFAKEKTPSKKKKKKTNPPNNYLLKNWSSEWKNYFEKKTSWGVFKPS